MKFHSRKLLFFIFTSFILVIPTLSFAAPSFSDVAEGTEHFAAVEYLKSKKIVSGYPDGTFQSAKTINRTEALKLVMIAADIMIEELAEISFPDVSKEDWFYDYVHQAFTKKIVKGYEDGTFKPENNITVAESLKMILASFDTKLPSSLTAAPYPDVAVSAWYGPYVEYGKIKQLIESRDDGTLQADRVVTRGEFAEILYRLLYMREQKLENFPLSTNWPLFQHPSLHYTMKYPFQWQKLGTSAQMIFWKQLNILGSTMGSDNDFQHYLDFINFHKKSRKI